MIDFYSLFVSVQKTSPVIKGNFHKIRTKKNPCLRYFVLPKSLSLALAGRFSDSLGTVLSLPVFSSLSCSWEFTKNTASLTLSWRFWWSHFGNVFNKDWSDCDGLSHPFGNYTTPARFPIEKVLFYAQSWISFWILLMYKARLTYVGNSCTLRILWTVKLNASFVPWSKRYCSSPNKRH